MRRLFITFVTLSFMCAGCSWLGFGDDSSGGAEDASAAADSGTPVQMEQNAPAEPAQTPAAASKKAVKASKGAKSEAQIKQELDAMGRKLAGQSARTLLPNAAHKEVAKRGGEWVAKYFHVDANNVTTELRPRGDGQYVGFIRYQEEIMECRGATREAALSAPCVKVGARRLNELIRYDGNAWQD